MLMPGDLDGALETPDSLGEIVADRVQELAPLSLVQIHPSNQQLQGVRRHTG
jgi:hypothetical protein